jgi:L-lactate dehydrogenase complex protein LldG
MSHPTADTRGTIAAATAPAGLATFLRALAARLREGEAGPLPSVSEDIVREVDPGGDLPARFAQTAQAAGCQVHRADRATWPAIAVSILRTHAVKSVLLDLAADPALDQAATAELEPRLREAGIAARRGHDDETMFSVDAAVTDVVAAIAESGVLVCATGAGRARGSSLIPPVHVAVVFSTQVLPDLYDFYAALGDRGPLPANVNLITGPSKTADIEGILVTGVHGPGHVHIVLM